MDPHDDSGADAAAKPQGSHMGDSNPLDDIALKAEEFAGDAQEAVAKKAEDAKLGLSDRLQAIGGALRAASDHLSESGQVESSKLVIEAASSVEHLAGSLESKPLGKVIEDLRTLGRENAGSLFAGSMLAGVMLGRLLRSSSQDRSASGPQASSPGPAGNDQAGGSPAPTTTATSGYAL